LGKLKEDIAESPDKSGLDPLLQLNRRRTEITPFVGGKEHKEGDSMEKRVRAALNDIRTNLQADGGDVEFVGVSGDGTVTVRLTGACGSCPMAQMTLKMGIEKYLKEKVPEVVEVVAV